MFRAKVGGGGGGGGCLPVIEPVMITYRGLGSGGECALASLCGYGPRGVQFVPIPKPVAGLSQNGGVECHQLEILCLVGQMWAVGE